MNEEVIRKNMLAIKQHADITRDQVSELRAEVKACHDTLATIRAQYAELQAQLQAIQVKLYTGGTTDGNHN